MINVKSSTNPQAAAGLINPRGEDENALQLLTSTVNGSSLFHQPRCVANGQLRPSSDPIPQELRFQRSRPAP